MTTFMFNQETGPSFNEICFHVLFEAQVQYTPDRIAVVLEDQQLTYNELNRRANQLARSLRRKDVGPDVIVGLYFERSLEMLISLLAILKSGGAYLPLSPTYPRERLSAMLQKVEVPIILTTTKLQTMLPTFAQSTCLCIDSDWPVIAQEPSTALPSVTSASHLAYLLFTSGSIGVPKGILVEHRSVVNLFYGLKQAIYAHLPSPPLHISLNGPLSFDTSVKQLLQLLAGHTLYLIPEFVRLDGEALQKHLSQYEIQVFDCTPSQLRLLLDLYTEGQQDFFPIALLVGGEAIDENLWRRLAALHDCQVYNLYGPTECTVDTTVGRVHAQSTTPTIGRPIANVTLHLLNSQLESSSEGELYISGMGLARGYLQAELTAEAFLPDPFSAEPGARMYKTGDLARLLPDGALAFMGRADHQVKIRGFRIEPGEIEKVLLTHEGVQDCAVIAHTYQDGSVRLVGYVVPVHFPDLTSSALRQFLQDRLPDYMVPAPIILLERFPLNSNGKLNRHALPAPNLDRIEPNTPLELPKTPVEEVLASIWEDVLGIKHIGRHDNFFALGGHSLLVTQTVARIRQAFQLEIPLYNLFEAPTIAEFAQIIMQVQADKQGATSSAPQRVSRDIPLPLTFAQERAWFMQQLYPQSRAYYFRTVLRLHGQVDIHLLEQTFTEIVRRHEILRTTFHEQDGMPVQHVHQPWSVSIPYIDLRSFPDDTRKEQEQQWIKREFERMFDLEHLPLVRWVLLHLQEQEYALIQTEHHLIHDGWSFNILLHEFKELYQAFWQREPSPLPELPLQFADFAHWQREWLNTEEASKQLAYWQQKLAGSLPHLPLPTDYPRPAVQSFKGALKRVEISPEMARELRALSRREGVTLFMLMLTAFKTLLYRYTHQQDILVGSGIANRRWRETEELIGMIINTIALRTDFSGSPTFKELLQRVRQTTLEAYANQDLPFEEVIRVLQPGRDLSSNPLVQVMFGFHDAPLPDLRLSSFSVEVLDLLDNGTAKFDLAVIVIPRAEQSVGIRSSVKREGITLIWEYNTDLFHHDTIERLLGHFHTLLTGIIVNVDQRLEMLPLLTTPEQQQLLLEWNRTQRPYPDDMCIHTLFEAAVEQFPDAIAIVAGEQQITYSEINRRANQLARYLLELGIGREERVGVCAGRQDFLLCILAILKVGACYVPFEPTFPQERLAYLLADTNACLILAQKDVANCLPAKRVQTVYIDEVPFQQYAQHNLPIPVFSSNAAYVMYTSGSTGQPKGITATHQGVVRLVMNTPYFPFSPNHTFVQLAPASFDASTFEIWGALLHGSRLVLFPSAIPSLDELGEVLQTQAITMLWLTTGLFHQVVDTHLSTLSQLRHLYTGGDVVSPSHVKKAVEALPHCQISSFYGPTEGTTFTTYYPVQPLEDVEDRVPIGKPIAHTQVYILDQWGQPVPVGVIGELYVGGDGLARGYLNKPELTAASFVPNPWSDIPGSRLYKTGDLARYRTNGVIEFIRRADTQVKLRGFRIELSEIEAVLLRAPGIQQCAVILHTNAQGDKHLVAYVVVDQPEQAHPQKLRAHLEKLLPSYMVPTFFIPMDTIPLTATAKIDRQVLAEEFQVRDAHTIIQPARPTEVVLVQIWKQVLAREDIGVEDDFFALGGHSLSLIRLQSRLRDHFQVKIPLQTLFVSTTIAEQATYIEERLHSAQPTPDHKHGETWPDRNSIGERKAEKSFFAPMSSAQQRQWFLDQLDPGNPAYNVFRGLHLQGPLSIDALQHSLQTMVERHEILRTSLVRVNGQLLQEILPTYTVTLPRYPLCASSEEALHADLYQQVLEAARHGFQLAHGPLWHVVLLEQNSQKHVLLLTFHHAILDGWSLTLFWQELQQCYAHFAHGASLTLPTLVVQYGEYAQKQQMWLAEEQAEQQITYWKRQLAGIQPLDLPFDYMRPAQPSFEGARLPVHLDASDLQALKALSQQQGATLFMTLLTAFDMLLACYTNANDIAVGTDVANRTSTEIEPLLGLFVNQLVLRISLRDDISFLEALREARTVTLEAYAHQDVPFEKLVELLRPEREANRNPLFQVKFVLQQPQMEDFDLADVHATVFNHDNHTAKFDLLLNMQEHASGLRGIVQYNTQLFERETIERFSASFILFLKRIAAQPDQTLRMLRELFAETEQAHKALQIARKNRQGSDLLNRTRRKMLTADKPAFLHNVSEQPEND